MVIWKAAFWSWVWNGNLVVVFLQDFLWHRHLIAEGLESEVCWRWMWHRSLVWDVASANASPPALPCVNWVRSEGQDGLERQEWHFGLVKWLLIVYVLVHTHTPNARRQWVIKSGFLLSPNSSSYWNRCVVAPVNAIWHGAVGGTAMVER